jgi:hypothetical protein
MNASPFDRQTGRSRRGGVTYKVWVCEWIRTREGARGPVHRVCWNVAGRRRGRSFRAWPLAEKFHGRLKAAALEGQPFDVASGLPVSMSPRGCAGRRGHGVGGRRAADGRG